MNFMVVDICILNDLLTELQLCAKGCVLLMTLQVFFSSYIFKANVMVQVATQQAANPVCIMVC